MKIKSIKKLTNGKYKILFDDGSSLTTYDDLIINNNVLYKKDISEELYIKLISENYYYEAYNKTLNYVLRRLRSKKEIIEYLSKYDLTETDRDKIIHKLEDNNLINDNMYAKAYISDAINLSNDGPDKIKKHLIDLDISEDIIDEEFSKIDNDIIVDKAYKIINKKFKSNNKYSAYQFNQKVLIDLVNMGYSRDLINNLLSNFEFCDDDLLANEYNKIKNKLSKKYSGYELFNKIKQKLYAKGFDINKINSFMENKRDEF